MRPGHGGYVLLELQDRKERVTADRLDSESGARHYLAVLDFDPVIEREPQASAKQDVDESSRRCGGRPEA